MFNRFNVQTSFVPGRRHAKGAMAEPPATPEVEAINAATAAGAADIVAAHLPPWWSVVVGDGPRGRRIIGIAYNHPAETNQEVTPDDIPF
jgi:hypothetical protein